VGGSGTAEHLASAPATVTVVLDPASCLDPAQINGLYSLDHVPMQSRPHYVSATGHHIYWADIVGGSWVIDTDISEHNGFSASYASNAVAPPAGALEWTEDCGTGTGVNTCPYANDDECDDGSQGGVAYCDPGTDNNDCGLSPVVITLAEQLTPANCAALAAEVLETPACAESAGSPDMCPVDCAFIYLEARDRCTGGSLSSAFEAAGPVGTFTGVCEGALGAAVLAAPDSLTLSGLSCNVRNPLAPPVL
jgi:hypothetical protein